MKKSKHGFIKEKLVSVVGKIGSAAEINAVNPFFLTLDEAGCLTVVGCDEITDYTSESVCFNCRKFTMTVSGKRLTVNGYSSESTVITGKFDSIRFDRGETIQ